MNSNKFWAAMGKALVAAAVMLVAILMLAAGASAASAEKVLYSFTGESDGAHPHQGLIFDQAGNLYGTTFEGGPYGAGNVYSLTPNGDGTWTQTVLYSFTGGSDGGWIDWGRLTFDTAGNLYGVTYHGGSHGAGTVFQLSPNGDGTWTENVLHQFTWGKDGAEPRTVPFFDAQGNLYGTVAYGGASGCGAVFKMTPGSNNKWTYHVIHQFADKPACSPWVGLIPDKAGSLYGTTRNQGAACNPPYECGTVFKLTPTSDGKWTYKVIHKFTGGKGGLDPSVSGLIFDDSGNLYGTTEHGGAYDSGVFFKLTSGVNDKWTFKVLHQFRRKTDGLGPNGQVTRDPAGNFYGTACLGGAYGYGTVYKMTPNQDGTWTFSVVYAFGGNDGNSPAPGGGVILDKVGNLYGTTVVGGAYGYGTVYELTP